MTRRDTSGKPGKPGMTRKDTSGKPGKPGMTRNRHFQDSGLFRAARSVRDRHLPAPVTTGILAGSPPFVALPWVVQASQK